MALLAENGYNQDQVINMLSHLMGMSLDGQPPPVNLPSNYPEDIDPDDDYDFENDPDYLAMLEEEHEVIENYLNKQEKEGIPCRFF